MFCRSNRAMVLPLVWAIVASVARAEPADDTAKKPVGDSMVPEFGAEDGVPRLVGQIRWIDPIGKKVWISLGEAAGLKPGAEFNVYKKTGNQVTRVDEKIKASIEVTRILAANLSEARIIEEDPSQPLAKGDLFVPRWRPIAIGRAGLVGIVVDRDGHPVEGATISASDVTAGKAVKLAGGQTILTDGEGRFSIDDLPDARISIQASIEYATGDADRTIQIPSTAVVEKWQSRVRIVLDPRLHRVPMKPAAKSLKATGSTTSKVFKDGGPASNPPAKDGAR